MSAHTGAPRPPLPHRVARCAQHLDLNGNGRCSRCAADCTNLPDTETVLDFTTLLGSDGQMLESPVPMACGHCGRPALYDTGDDAYHHADDPGQGCFGIPPEPGYPVHHEHPLMLAASADNA